jgi:asparagine synthetase B (glutamine-hydrolysing)
MILHMSASTRMCCLFTRAYRSLIATGHQPMHDGDGVIICDGEIYNYLELKKDKEIYRTNSDTEVLLCGIGRSGIDYLRSLLHNGLLINSLSLIC